MDRAIETAYAPGIWKFSTRTQRMLFFSAATLIPLFVTLVTACLVVSSLDVFWSCLLFTGPLYVVFGITLTKLISGKKSRSLKKCTKTTRRVSPGQRPGPVHYHHEIDYKWHLIDEMMNGL